MSQNIQEIVEHTKSQADAIDQAAKDTVVCVDDGLLQTNQLKAQAKIVTEGGIRVIGATNTLLEKTEEVQKITEVILGIADNTDLLALNASIEAARAGNQGSGFAVVAEEIRSLAEQTKNATQNISTLLGELHTASYTVKSVVDEITEETKEQNHMIEQVSHRFTQVSDTMVNLEDSVTLLHGKVNELTIANETIVSNINTLSAVSEEVSAQTIQVCRHCEMNVKDVNVMSGLIGELSEDVQGFEKIAQENYIEEGNEEEA